MSVTPYFFVERFDFNTGKYELQHPLIWDHNHTKQESADLFPYNGCHDLFSIVKNDCYNDFPEMRGIHQGLPKDVSEPIKIAYDGCCYNINAHTYKPTARWFTYADMYIYCLEHPEVPDYEAMDEIFEKDGDSSKRIMKSTPLNKLKHRVDAFLEVMDDWGWQDDYSLIRIVYWIE